AVVRGRGAPGPASSRASRGGVVAGSAWVRVGPPLSWSGPSLGLPETAGLQLPSWTRFLSFVLIVPPLTQSPPAGLPAMMGLVEFSVPPLLLTPPPLLVGAGLPLMVVLTSGAVGPSWVMSPPPAP